MKLVIFIYFIRCCLLDFLENSFKELKNVILILIIYYEEIYFYKASSFCKITLYSTMLSLQIGIM